MTTNTLRALYLCVQGTLSFSKNGASMGVAFQDSAFCSGEFYAAVAPIYMGDSFEVVQPELED